jgi:hypothetical protein
MLARLALILELLLLSAPKLRQDRAEARNPCAPFPVLLILGEA